MKLPNVDKTIFFILSCVVVILLGIMIMVNRNHTAQNVPQTSEFDKEIQQIKTQSTSDDVDSIEKDLKNTDLTGMDSELNDIEKELNTLN